MDTPRSLRVLFVEDSDDDAALVERQLRRYGFDPVIERIETADALAATLDGGPWDILLLDYTLPRFGALQALAFVRERGFDLPSIIVSGVAIEENAVEVMRAGAGDFVRKDNLARLGPAIERELHEAENRRQRRRAEADRDRLLADLEAERNWLRAVIDDSPVGILRVEDAEGRRVVANRRAEELFGRRFPPEGGIAHYVGQIYRFNGSARRLEDMVVWRALRGERVAPEDGLIRRPDGEEVHVLVSAVPIRNDRGIVGAVVAYEDVTRLRELERLRDEWNSIVAHDLRQPISIILAQAGMLKRYSGKELGERSLQGVERLLTAARTMDRMVDDLLDSSRVETRRLTLSPEEIDLTALVRDVVDRLTSDEANQRIRVSSIGRIPTVLADPTRISQVIGNLLSNARKYGEAGSEIRVDVMAREGAVEVAVSNRGPGIAPEELSRLFTRFYRTDGARTSAADGLGLGLYISNGLIEAHGGRIWAESTPGETTTFRFTLPLAPPDSQ